YGPPTKANWFGTDELGRDVLSRMIWGARIVFGIAVSSTAVAIVVGVGLGLLAGFLRGWVDIVISRFADVLLAFPTFLLAVALVSGMGNDPSSLIMAIGITRLPRFIRITRAEVLRVAEMEYIA